LGDARRAAAIWDRPVQGSCVEWFVRLTLGVMMKREEGAEGGRERAINSKATTPARLRGRRSVAAQRRRGGAPRRAHFFTPLPHHPSQLLLHAPDSQSTAQPPTIGATQPYAPDPCVEKHATQKGDKRQKGSLSPPSSPSPLRRNANAVQPRAPRGRRRPRRAHPRLGVRPQPAVGPGRAQGRARRALAGGPPVQVRPHDRSRAEPHDARL